MARQNGQEAVLAHCVARGESWLCGMCSGHGGRDLEKRELGCENGRFDTTTTTLGTGVQTPLGQVVGSGSALEGVPRGPAWGPT